MAEHVNHASLIDTHLLRACIDAAGSDREQALRQSRSLLVEDVPTMERAQLHYWLWKLDTSDPAEKEREEALRLYRVLVEIDPRYMYHIRIDELESARKRA